MPPIDRLRRPTESRGSAEKQAAPAKGSLFSLLLGHGTGAAAWAPGSRGRCRRQIPARGAGRVGRATAAASPAGRGAGKLREDNSRAEKPLPRAARGQRQHQPPRSPPGEGPATRGRGEEAPPAGSAGPGGPEGHRRADEQGVQRFRSCREPPPGPCLPPSPSANTLRPPAGPVTTPEPGRRRAHTRGPHPSNPTRPLPGTQPGPTARPAAGPQPCAPSRLTCAPRQLCTSSPAPRAPSGHAPTPRPGLPGPR